MKKSFGLILTCVLLLCFGVSCEKTTTSRDATSQVASPVSDIPSSYGSLVSVTSVPEYPGWFQLWFQDDVGTIRMVRIQAIENLIHDQVKVYPRSQPVVEEVTEDEG